MKSRVVFALILGVSTLTFAQGVPSTAPAQDGAPKVFRIQPVRPVEEVRREALKLEPPAQSGDLRKPDLVELVKLDPSIHLDIRYATSDNFLSTPMYSQARAFLQRPAAEAVVRANKELHKLGYGLLIHDAYRPWYVTWMFWEATPPSLHNFVADPKTGSHHNRGCAVDLTLYDLKTGKAVEMPSLYDEMSERAYPTYQGGTPTQRNMRDILITEMKKQGFDVYEYEWWHFDYKDWQKYPVMNVRFEEIGKARSSSHPDVLPDSPPTTEPELAADIDGVVVLWAVVNEEGKLVTARVVKSLRKDLDKRALEAVKTWRFEPAEKDGRPVAVQINIEVRFREP